MPESRRPTATERAADQPRPEPARTPAAPAKQQRVYRGRAGESGDPELHQLLAELQTAEMNADEVAIAAIRKQIDGLGYLL